MRIDLVCLSCLVASTLLVSGCDDCRGFIQIVGGAQPVLPSQTIQLSYHYDGEMVSGPGKCEGHWYVNDIEGGDEIVGKIDRCGLYVAPDGRRGTTVRVTATTYPIDGCADCCPYAMMDLAL